jgi:hypothetical protein
MSYDPKPFVLALDLVMDGLERRHERLLRKKIEVEEVVIAARKRGESVDPRTLASYHDACGRFDEARRCLNAAVREYEKARKASRTKGQS